MWHQRYTDNRRLTIDNNRAETHIGVVDACRKELDIRGRLEGVPIAPLCSLVKAVS